MSVSSLKEVLGLLLIVAVVAGRFILLEERVELTRQTCATLSQEIRELREQINKAQRIQARSNPVLE